MHRKESSWENPIIITEPDGQKVDSKFQVFTNEEQVWIMYSSDSGKEDGKGLYALIYDKEEERWGQPVQLIKSEGCLRSIRLQILFCYVQQISVTTQTSPYIYM